VDVWWVLGLSPAVSFFYLKLLLTPAHTSSLERAMKTAEQKQQKKEVLIDQMAPEQVLIELKEKRLPTYGTA